MQTFPLLPGVVKQEIRCYRHLDRNSFWERLQRSYIGGRSRTFYLEQFHDEGPITATVRECVRFHFVFNKT